MSADRLLLLLLRFNAAILLCAAPCALLPFEWMDAVHRWLGLGSLPNAPITLYLARSLSLTYALHGALVFGLTRNWPRYRPLVPLLACLHIAFGCAIVAVDVSAGLPWWWAAGEGTSAGFGLALFVVYRGASREQPRVP